MESKSKSAFLKFLGVFLPFCLLLFICDFSIGKLLEYEYRSVKSGVIRKTTFIIDEMRTPYVVFGSSRASRHYKSSVFSQQLADPFYNCGRDGQEMIYVSAVTTAAMNRYQPKFVIVDVLPEEFTKSEEGKLGALLPYHENKTIRPFLNYNGKFQNIKLLSKIYPYNSMLTTILAGRYGADANSRENGYLPLYGNKPSAKIQPLKDQEDNVDLNKFHVFQELLRNLERKKIRTLLVISPLYKTYKQGSTVRICKLFAAKLKYVQFLNYTNLQEYRNPEIYADDYHLNDKGASKFSADLASKIVKLQSAGQDLPE